MKTIAEVIGHFAHPFNENRGGYAPLLKLIRNANVVLLGAQTHGTHEFYRARANITKNLIEDKGFNAVVIEADWPDACRVNQFIHAEGTDADSEQALAGFANFPTWIWRNVDMLDLVGWLRTHNDAALRSDKKVSFYGMDLFSLHKSINAVVHYLEQIDPSASREARVRYGCFDHFGDDVKTYGFATRLGLKKSCEEAGLKEFIELRRRHDEYLQQDGLRGEEDLFSAEQNARSVENVERYYRAMFNDRTLAWNQRETHMVETLSNILKHLASRYGHARIVVWSHNRHVGDARAVHANFPGMVVSLGELARQQFGPGAMLVGFTTNSGTVTCASDWWASPPHRVVLKPAMEGSYESLFHRTRHRQFMLTLRDMNDSAKESLGSRPERAIGIVYRPESEEKDCYFEAQLARQFDAIVHVDQTRAVEPLGFQTEWEKGEMPETFPMGV